MRGTWQTTDSGGGEIVLAVPAALAKASRMRNWPRPLACPRGQRAATGHGSHLWPRTRPPITEAPGGVLA
jgi:hypothetical protein